jgi:hypothetical protein
MPSQSKTGKMGVKKYTASSYRSLNGAFGSGVWLAPIALIDIETNPKAALILVISIVLT